MFPSWLIRPAILVAVFARVATASDLLDEQRHFLGAPGQREWVDFDGEKPESSALELKFSGHANAAPATLFLRQRDVKLRWAVLLNGRKLGQLELNEVFLETALTIPPGTLREGENALSIIPPPGEGDDIVIDRVRLDPRPPGEALGEATLRLDGKDAESGAPLPCRFTIVDAAVALAPVLPSPGQSLAVRTGVVYTAEGTAEIRVPAGEYTIFCTRGFEYGLASQKVALSAGQQESVALSIRREVDTTGLAACDPHVHTFTLSKHGDATLDERMLSLAGEGVELPVSADHNVYADYREPMRRMHVEPFFTWIPGCEVTTTKGHFIAFPVASPEAPLPDFRLTEWPALMESMRGIPGVQAIVLNHPRDTHNDFIPFAPENFDERTGENLRGGGDFTFDAIEVANSGTLQSDLSRSWRDWFALLNRGLRVTAVGSSDSHDVARFIVGQGRTYIACDDRDPGKIDIAEAVRNFRAGHAYVSLGLLATLTVNGKYAAGDVAVLAGDEVKVEVRVAGPSWVRAEKAEVYANGEKIREVAIEHPAAPGDKTRQTFTLPRPARATWLVVIATGPGVREPYWNIPFPYQPAGRLRDPRVLGLSNPVWLPAR